MPEVITPALAATPSAADEAVKASNALKVAEDAVAAQKTAENIAAAKPDFTAEAARIAALPEAERPAAQTVLDEKKKAAEAIAGTLAAGKPVVPEKYDLKLPDGSKLDPAFVERTAAIARELGLDQKGAEQLLANRTKEIADVTAALKAPDLKTGLGAGPLWIARDDAFRKEAFADKQFGNGDKATFDTHIEQAQQGLKILEQGSPDVRALLNESGWGSHPVVLKALASLGKRGAEGAQVRGQGGAGERVKSAAEQMFPSMYNDDGIPKL
jgi:hypothetical protein